ncbi:MAG: hypothetical protein O2819_02200 [Planctomycetota bacterium]|nr:hypothetical protein [Planctomycetota bacterium]MDA1106317.1 hypothetical protein [Planctomycetota bacterium]
MNRLNTIISLATTLSLGLAVAVAQNTPPDAPKTPPSQGDQGGQGAKGGQDGAKGQKGDRPGGDRAKRGARDKGGQGGPGGDMMGRMGGAMQELEMARTAMADVQPALSDEQKAEVEAIREAFKTQVDAWRAENEDKMRELTKKMREARQAGGDIDPALMEQAQALRDGAPNAKATFDKVRNTMSPEQQKSFDDNLAKKREEAKRKRGGDRPQRPGQGKDGQGKDGKGADGTDRPQRPGQGKDGAPPPPAGGDKPVFDD